jgi:hypothetical protein
VRATRDPEVGVTRAVVLFEGFRVVSAGHDESLRRAYSHRVCRPLRVFLRASALLRLLG